MIIPRSRPPPAICIRITTCEPGMRINSRTLSKLNSPPHTNAAEFQALINPLELDDSAKCFLFHKGLKPRVKDTITNIGRATTFTLLLDQAISIDQRKHQCELEEKKSSSSDSKNLSSRSEMGSSGSCRVWGYDPTRSMRRFGPPRPTRSEPERV